MNSEAPLWMDSWTWRNWNTCTLNIVYQVRYPTRQIYRNWRTYNWWTIGEEDLIHFQIWPRQRTLVSKSIRCFSTPSGMCKTPSFWCSFRQSVNRSFWCVCAIAWRFSALLLEFDETKWVISGIGSHVPPAPFFLHLCSLALHFTTAFLLAVIEYGAVNSGIGRLTNLGKKKTPFVITHYTIVTSLTTKCALENVQLQLALNDSLHEDALPSELGRLTKLSKSTHQSSVWYRYCVMIVAQPYLLLLQQNNKTPGRIIGTFVCGT